MRRLFWVGVGSVATVVVIRKVRGLLDRHTPPGMRTAVDTGGALLDTVRTFGSDLRTAMAERERELHRNLFAERDARPPGSRRERPVDDEPPYEF